MLMLRKWREENHLMNNCLLGLDQVSEQRNISLIAKGQIDVLR